MIFANAVNLGTYVYLTCVTFIIVDVFFTAQVELECFLCTKISEILIYIQIYVFVYILTKLVAEIYILND